MVNVEELLTYICQHAEYAHYFIFGLLILSGLNIPISEDILIIGGGLIASTCIPDHAIRLYLWLFAAVFIADSESYWIGRILGPKLFNFKFFRDVLTPKRMQLLRRYYAKYGVFTFIVGRFFPGGVRFALFTSAGLSKMAYPLFLLRDFCAALISTFSFFMLGYHFGKNFDNIAHYVHLYKEWLLVIISIVSTIILYYFWSGRCAKNKH